MLFDTTGVPWGIHVAARRTLGVAMVRHVAARRTLGAAIVCPESVDG